jgi:hypothetical protein
MIAVAGRIPVVIGLDIDAHGVAPVRPVFEHGVECLANEVGTEILMRQPFGQAMDHRFFKRILVEDRGVEKRRQQRVARHSIRRLIAHRSPDRIDRLH